MRHLWKWKFQKAFYLKDWKFNIFSPLTFKSIRRNNLMRYKNEVKKILDLKFLFRSR